MLDYRPVPADRHLPAYWLTNVDNVPIAPPVIGQARLDYIQMLRQAELAQVMPGEERPLPKFNALAQTSWWRPKYLKNWFGGYLLRVSCARHKKRLRGARHKIGCARSRDVLNTSSKLCAATPENDGHAMRMALH